MDQLLPEFPFRARELCFFIGVAASACLEKLLSADRLQVLKVLDTMDNGRDPGRFITASSDELLKLFGADCGLFVLNGEARSIGKLTSYSEVLTLSKYFCFRKPTQITTSSKISSDYQDIEPPGSFSSIAGVMCIPLSSTSLDFVFFFRKEQRREVHWAGNPHLKSATTTLEPRKSFAKWTEVVRDTSKEWTRAQLRTPLNAVINYLEIALERPLDDITRQTLAMSHAASRSLLFVIDDLLHLTGSTAGSSSELSEPFGIATCLEAILSPLRDHAERNGIQLTMSADPSAAQKVRGDPARFQRAISVLVVNAVMHTAQGEVTVEWSQPLTRGKDCVVRVAVRDTSIGLTRRELDDLFQELEQIPDEDFDEQPTATLMSTQSGVHAGVGLL
ncbi:hypothetical protein GQ53DRAFT_828605 [Thozetella sp. PMI_491]|nr:hypothetical protein GQ53DRAFT_828605 [Thozetella sp. PMI_491]